MGAITKGARSAKRLGIGAVLVGVVLVGGTAAGAAATNGLSLAGGGSAIAKAYQAMHDSPAMQEMHARGAGAHAAMHDAMSGMMTGTGMMSGSGPMGS